MKILQSAVQLISQFRKLAYLLRPKMSYRTALSASSSGTGDSLIASGTLDDQLVHEVRATLPARDVMMRIQP